jgi:ABC-type nickel/cobalt efflux system permease component RcnA
MMTILSLTMLGFFLGMRHATDPDHVIAVSTIVTRQPTIRGALLIGSLWGIGHTLTIVAVGSAIVLFTIVIPPRIGLSMEMAVALMLIVLGMWNLTGFLEQIRGFRLAGADGQSRWHAHSHSYGDYVHSHPCGSGPNEHGHRDDETPATWLDRRFGSIGCTRCSALCWSGSSMDSPVLRRLRYWFWP